MYWKVSPYTNGITRVKAQNDPRAWYFTDWHEAHKALVERLCQEREAAEKEYKRAQSVYSKAVAMVPPEDA